LESKEAGLEAILEFAGKEWYHAFAVLAAIFFISSAILEVVKLLLYRVPCVLIRGWPMVSGDGFNHMPLIKTCKTINCNGAVKYRHNFLGDVIEIRTHCSRCEEEMDSEQKIERDRKEKLKDTFGSNQPGG
jgi:hypothetical protein